MADDMSGIIVLHGAEDYFIRSAVKGIRNRIRARSPEVELIQLDAAHYQKYSLNEALSASLFSSVKLVEVENVAGAAEDFSVDALNCLAHMSSTNVLVLQHAGGNKNKKILTSAKKQGAQFIDCKALIRERDKQDFVRAQFREAGINVTQDVMIDLINAVGADISELASAVNQLIADVNNEGMPVPSVTAAMVDQYYGGRVEATVFKVAEVAMTGTISQALSSFRFALATGVDLVPLVAVLAMRARTLVRVASYSGTQAAKDLGLAPWQIEQARRNLNAWTPQGLTRGIQAIAYADAQVKGAGENPEYAVEKAIITLVQARQTRS